jgi:hypothetical protein
LFEGVHDAYVYEKAPKTCREYFKRVQRVREELGLPYDKQWDSLEMISDKAKEHMVSKKNKSKS